ncbi:PorP/SprF family type IX secretion system membrane protein [Maribacter halichondriae]|uniref:PorP/SprF family type IX secretion system membrane protein n=1 Tax=Maribacter halichondriae TaxID=2980554 RepID=UPI00235A2870|nr:PorP/SprF family type IX secretion system membrane protein [Maribacter sp. Hal144]
MKLTKIISLCLVAFLAMTSVNAQNEDPILPLKVAPQNLLKYNRFLINPTFSTVQEDKSYINFLHRNQSVQFDNNDQTYFLSYSGRIGDRSGLGLSVYSQRVGLVSNIGVMANYAYGVKLSDKSNFTFGANLAYYNTGFDRNNANPLDPNDQTLFGTVDSNILSFQPGFNLSFGNFDFGAYAENLFDYNLKTSQQLTEFKDKSYAGHLQYTHRFENGSGIMENARLMPLARVRMNAKDSPVLGNQDDLTLGGSLILDLPKLGWLQGGYDSFYGASAGVGFNLNKRLSLGYTMEKGYASDLINLGVTHEISFAYAFTPNLTEDRVMLEENGEELVKNEELTQDDLASSDEIEELKKKLAENDAILAELMFRQDSLEANRQKDLERRFEMVMKMVKSETKGERPDLEKRAEELFLTGEDKPEVAQRNDTNDGGISQNQNASRKTEDGLATRVERASAQDNTNPQNIANAQDVAQQSPVKSRKFRNLEGVQDGYYVVANVYKGGHYLDKFIDDLGQKGISADYIDNPNNGLKYVYLQRYDTWDEAVAAHESKVDGTYDGDLWIMNVDNRYSNERYASNANKIKEKSEKYGTDVLQKNVIVNDEIENNGADPRTFKIDGVGSGYYIIANVFANPKNATRFIELLNSYGLSASYFVNPENNWRYVYLKRHESWNNALISYYSKLNDAYDDKMWIMRVSPNNMA